MSVEKQEEKKGNQKDKGIKGMQRGRGKGRRKVEKEEGDSVILQLH